MIIVIIIPTLVDDHWYFYRGHHEHQLSSRAPTPSSSSSSFVNIIIIIIITLLGLIEFKPGVDEQVWHFHTKALLLTDLFLVHLFFCERKAGPVRWPHVLSLMPRSRDYIDVKDLDEAAKFNKNVVSLRHMIAFWSNSWLTQLAR